jgi:AcrR family transcriptional regulator
MQRRGEEFQQHVLAVATDLFYQNGFRATGVDEVAKTANCTKRSIYRHFPSKDELIAAMLWERHTLWIDGLKNELDRQARTAKGKLVAWFNMLSESLQQPSYRGCIFFNASIEFPKPPAVIRRVLAENTRVGNALLLSLTTAAGASNPADAAHELGIIRRGAQISMSVTKDPRTGEYAKNAAIHVLHRYGVRISRLDQAGPSSMGLTKEIYV